jgi:hypothetical protein
LSIVEAFLYALHLKNSEIGVSPLFGEYLPFASTTHIMTCRKFGVGCTEELAIMYEKVFFTSHFKWPPKNLGHGLLFALVYYFSSLAVSCEIGGKANEYPNECV